MSDDLESRVEELEGLVELQRERMTHAMEKIGYLEEELEETRQDRERLIFRVGKLEECLPERSTPYDELSREEKVSMLKSHLMEMAYSRNGRCTMDYKDVMHLFDSNPSPGHCYRLMELAGSPDGFTYVDPSTGNKQLRVNLDETKAESGFSRVNKDESGEAR